MKKLITSLFVALSTLTFAQTTQQKARTVAILDNSDRNGDHDGRQFSLEQMLSVAGVPYVTTKWIGEASEYAMIIANSGAVASTYNSLETDSIELYVANGGILVSPNIKDPNLYGLFGISNYVSSTYRYELTFNSATNDESFEWIDEPEEWTISFGDVNKLPSVYTRGYIVALGAEVLATWNDNSPGIVSNDYQSGKTYALGFSFQDAGVRNMVNRDISAHRVYSNGFEPSSDVVALFLRALYQKHFGFAVWKHTSPVDSRYSVMITHDIDSRTAMDSLDMFVNLEDSFNIKTTYNVTTSYYSNGWFSGFYANKKHRVQCFLDHGHEIGSHSVGHFPDFYSTSSFPMGAPTTDTANYNAHYSYATETSTGGTVFGEMGISQWLLEQDFGVPVRIFRSGHLSFNKYQSNVLDSLGYEFDSSISANDCLQSFPYIMKKDQKFSGAPSSVYEIPMTISDVYSPPVGGNIPTATSEIYKDDMIAAWNSATTKYGNNYSPIVLLVHPNRTWKVDAQRQYINAVDSRAVFIEMGKYGDYWKKRRATDFFAHKSNDTLYIEFQTLASNIDSTFSLMMDDYNNISIVVAQDVAGTHLHYQTSPMDGRTILYNFVDMQYSSTNDLGASIDDLKIYPNPTNDAFRIKSDVELESIRVYGIDGKLVYQSAKPNNEISVSDWSKGIYLVQIFDIHGNTTSTKLIVE